MRCTAFVSVFGASGRARRWRACAVAMRGVDDINAYLSMAKVRPGVRLVLGNEAAGEWMGTLLVGCLCHDCALSDKVQRSRSQLR